MSRVIKILHLGRGSCQPHKSRLLCFTNETRAAGTVLITSSISFTLAWNFICVPTATGFYQQLTLSGRKLNQMRADLLLTTSQVIKIQEKKGGGGEGRTKMKTQKNHPTKPLWVFLLNVTGEGPPRTISCNVLLQAVDMHKPPLSFTALLACC